MIPTKKCIVITISNSPLVQVTSSSSITSTLTCGTFQQKIQNKKTVANSDPHGAVCNTILIDNKPYKLVKDPGPSGQMRAVFMQTIPISPLVQGTASSSNNSTSTITTCQSVNGPSDQMRATDNDTFISPPTVIIRVCKIH